MKTLKLIIQDHSQRVGCGSHSNKCRRPQWLLWLFSLAVGYNANAQAPSLSYSAYGGPQTYTVGTAISTLTPTNSGGTIVARGQSVVLAGNPTAGYTNATGIVAQFNAPNGTAIDGSGNIYLADNGNNVIRKITSAGVVTTLAGSGSTGATNGTGTAATFTHPTGVCLDASGNLYVADAGNNMIRKIVISTTVVTTLAGSTTPGHADGTGTGATFFTPSGIAFDGSSNLYVADAANNMIRKIVISTGVVTTFAGATTSGSTNGTGTAARFNDPTGITIDGSGNSYVADFANNMVRKIVISTAAVTTLAGSTTSGSTDGTGTSASFFHPAGVSVNGSSNIYVADAGNGKVRMITSAGVVTTYTTGLSNPYGIAVNSSGVVFLGEANNNTVDKISAYNYSISPVLSGGLAFNASTGAISGTPTATSPSTNYTITAISASGSGSVTLNFTVGVLAPSELAHGFIQSETIKIAGVVNDTSIYSLSDMQKQTTRLYYDGLGRSIQSIGLQASPGENDIIQPMAYDNVGRPVAAYLSYAGSGGDVIGSYRSNALTSGQGLAAFYNQTSQYIIPVDTAPHANSIYEASPLQRIKQSGIVGSGYQPEDSGTQHYKTLVQRYNTSGDGNIIIWVPSNTGTFSTDGNYAVNSLSVTDGTDEANVETLTFTDRSGHLILKRQVLSGGNLDTYYLYNQAGMVSYIIPPAATNVLATNSYNLTTSPLVNMVFYYIYNSFGQVISRKVPAKGTQNIVYDPLHRPVLTQDANMVATNLWTFVKYDVKGHCIEAGTYSDSNTGRTTPSGMQSYVSSLSFTTWYESRSATLTSGGYYTNSVFPVAGTNIILTPLSYSYFDDYDMNFNGSADFSYSTQGLTGESTPTTAKLKGIPTMSSMTTIGNGLTSTWLTKVSFYDKRLNPIQTQSNNHVNYTNQTTITDYATVIPDFMGIPQQAYVTKKSSSTVTIQVLSSFIYDHMYRILNVSQAYNGGPTASVTKVAAYTYNEIGQVVQKSLGYVNSTTWLQNVNMRYNIRGQLLSINNSTLTSDGGVTSGDSNDAFGAVYLYDQADASLGNTAYFNGKVSAVKWMSLDASGVKTKERSYVYSYDGVDRYTASTYGERTTAGSGNFTANPHGFDEYGITYDMNGNIKTMKRNSSTQGTGTHVQIDSLVYTYGNASIPDQLTKVTDGTGSNYTGAGFRNLTASTGNYSYDSNGNLTADPYKGLAVSFNNLNRTDKITITTAANRYIYYTYDATGNLIRKQQYDNNLLQATTDYVDGFVYITQSGTTALSYFPMPEGRVLNTGSGGSVTLTQEFIIGDQQGNARVSFKNNGSNVAVVTQENSYYGFGLVLPNSPVATTGTSNKQLYNGGSEWQNDYSNLPDYYETYYRNYDAAIARWVGVDPDPEAAESTTPYHYSGNNPIMYNDPLGNFVDPGKSPWADPTQQKNNTPSVVMTWHDSDFSEAVGVGGGDHTAEKLTAWGVAEHAAYNVNGFNELIAVTGVSIDANYNTQGISNLNSLVVDVNLMGGSNSGSSSSSYNTLDIYKGSNGVLSYSAYDGSGGTHTYDAVTSNTGGAYVGNGSPDANQVGNGKYPVGLLQAVAIAYAESAGNDDLQGQRAIASSIKDRLNASHIDLNDPNWAKHTSYGKTISGGDVVGNYNVVSGKGKGGAEYMNVMHLGFDKLTNNKGIQAIIAVFNQSGGPDYSNPYGYPSTGNQFFWIATEKLHAPTSQYSPATMIITLQTPSGTTFFRTKK